MSTETLNELPLTPTSTSDIDTVILEMINTWDEDYLCGCGLYDLCSTVS